MKRLKSYKKSGNLRGPLKIYSMYKYGEKRFHNNLYNRVNIPYRSK